jgi:hypothetical protein
MSAHRLLREFGKQRLRFLQIEHVEAVAEPAVDRSEQVARRSTIGQA